MDWLNRSIDAFFFQSRVMDYPTFEKAMDRAGKALFLDNDTERCMKIMQSIIIKFDSIR